MKWSCLALLLPVVAWGGELNWGTVTGNRFRADYVSPAPMRLRVFSPKGGTVEIRSNNKVVAKGSIPFAYKPEQEGFVSVSVTLPSGKRWWANSVRMKEKTECQLWVLGPPGSEGPTVEDAAPSAEPSATPESAPAGSTEGAIEPPASPSGAHPAGETVPPPPPDEASEKKPAPAPAPAPADEPLMPTPKEIH